MNPSFVFALCLRYVALHCMYGYSTATDSGISHELFFGLCAISAHQTYLSGHDISVNEGTFSPFPFHTTAYIFPWENSLTQWDHYCLFTSVFCIWRAGKPVVVTHRPMHNAGTAGLWSACARVWRCVRLAWSFISCATWFTPPLLTSYNARPWKRSKWKRCFAFICNTLQSNLSEATHKIHLPSS